MATPHGAVTPPWRGKKKGRGKNKKGSGEKFKVLEGRRQGGNRTPEGKKKRARGGENAPREEKKKGWGKKIKGCPSSGPASRI